METIPKFAQTFKLNNYILHQFRGYFYSMKKESPQKPATREMMHDYLKNNNISIQNETDVNFRHCVLTDRDSMVHYPPDAEFHKVYFIQGHQRPNDGSKASIRHPDRRNCFE